MVRKKCECCNATTDKNLDDYSDIGWSAYKIGRNKVKSFCPYHLKIAIKKIEIDMLKSAIVNKESLCK